MTSTRLTPAPPRRRPASLLAVFATIALAGADPVPSDPQFSALKVDGSTVVGRLRGLDVKAGAVLLVDDKDRSETVAAATLIKLVRDGGTAPTGTDGAIVLFPDGDRLYRAVIGPAGETSIEVTSPSLGSLAVPLDGLLGLVLAPPPEADAVQAITARLRDEPRSGEVLWLSNGDRLTGGLLGLDDKKVAFQAPGGKVEVDRSGVVALGFDPKFVVYPRPSGPFLELTLVDGSRLGVTTAHVEGGIISATTRYGQALKVPVGELAQVHTVDGPAVYLSDRKPTLDKYVSYVGPSRPARMNRAVDGQPLRLGGRSFDRGIGTQSKSYLVYQIEPGVKRFQATVGVDDHAGPLGGVVFRVVVDGKEAFASPSMSVRESPRSIDVDLSGAKTLILITDFGERGGVRDHADWVEARLIR